MIPFQLSVVLPQTRQHPTGSRRGSDDSSEGSGDAPSGKDRDLRMELRSLEEKYKTAMMSSAQLDNEKQSLVYQVELLKDQLEEQAESYVELQREYKDKCRVSNVRVPNNAWQMLFIPVYGGIITVIFSSICQNILNVFGTLRNPQISGVGLFAFIYFSFVCVCVCVQFVV